MKKEPLTHESARMLLEKVRRENEVLVIVEDVARKFDSEDMGGVGLGIPIRFLARVEKGEPVTQAMDLIATNDELRTALLQMVNGIGHSEITYGVPCLVHKDMTGIDRDALREEERLRREADAAEFY